MIKISYLEGFLLILLPVGAASQVPDSLQGSSADAFQEKIELYTEQKESETDFSDWVDELEKLKDRPVNLNSPEENELRRLPLLNEIQVQNLLTYTREFGQIASVYELPMIDGFNEETVLQLLPYISLSDSRKEKFSLKKAIRYGKTELTSRYQRVLEPQAGFQKVDDSTRQMHPNNYYLGSPDALYNRILFKYRDQLQMGLITEKDAGESVLPKPDSLRKGFDFFSAHLFFRDLGNLKYLAIGDYHVQFGQGLTLSSGLSFGKSPATLPMRKRSSPLRPHSSANESGFYRGIATTYQLGIAEITGFYSCRRRDASRILSDTLNEQVEYFSSLQETGYHRTSEEIADRNAVLEKVIGGHIAVSGNRIRAGVTFYHSSFDKEFQPRSAVYNTFIPSNTSTTVAGLDWGYSYKRLTLYGETSKQFYGGLALVQGMSFTPDPGFSIAMVYRNYQRNYSNRYAGSFGAGSSCTNENGLYLGIMSMPARNMTITAYSDLWRYPWLHYRVDAPATGQEYSVQLSLTSGRKGEWILRYRQSINALNNNLENGMLPIISNQKRKNIQLQFSYQALPWLKLSSRFYFLEQQTPDKPSAKGYFVGQDFQVNPITKRWNLYFRFALFDTDSYETRMYAYENDVPNSFSIPSLSGKGSRAYLMIKLSPAERINVWLRFSQTWYSDTMQISSAAAMIIGDCKSDIKAMVKIDF